MRSDACFGHVRGTAGSFILKTVAIVTNPRDNQGNIANGIRVGHAFEKIGYTVKYLHHSSATEIKNLYGVDLILCFGTVISEERQHPGLLLSIRKAMPLSSVLALWYFDICHPGMKNSPWKFQTMYSIVHLLDVLSMTDSSYDWPGNFPGLGYLNLMQGIEENEFGEYNSLPEPREADFIFTGGFMPPFQERLSAINRLRENFTVRVFGRDSNRQVHGQLFISQHSKARAVFVPPPPSWTPGPYWSNRIFLAAATGTPCLVGHTPEIDKYYLDGQEVICYRSQEEMLSKASLLIDDPGLRQRIGSAGRKRTIGDHKYTDRVRSLMEYIYGDQNV